MSFCSKCGQVLIENNKFCTKCGTPIDSSSDSDILENRKSTINLKKNSEDINENSNYLEENQKPSRNKFPIIIVAIIVVLVVSVMGAILVYSKINTKQKNPSTEIINVDVTDYPSISLRVKASDYSQSLNVENFTLKEQDSFQKNLQLVSGVDENEYIISYKTSDESTSGQRNIKIAYSENNKESIAEGSYQVPEKSKDNSKAIKSDNAVTTYDNNETAVKSVIESYLSEFIQMVNSKNTSNIKNVLDSNGSILGELNSTVDSYKEQDIDEDLINHSIQAISKISENQYEVVTYEKYKIYYGKKNETKIIEFRMTYVINKTSLGFKVNSIKKIENLSSN